MLVSHAVILGIVQGITEILPISSSAHLVIVPWLLRWQYQGLAFDIALHLGTAMAFIIYFYKDWLEIIAAGFTKNSARKSSLLWLIALGTIPAGIAGLILEKQAETIFRSPLLIALTLGVFAIILYIADRLGKKQKTMKQLELPGVIVIGLAQMLAVIPGVSRSGITITAGLFTGLNREAAARFSFLLATPIVIAAGILKFSHLQVSQIDAAFLMGVLFSAVSGLAGISFFLKFVKKSSLNLFIFYRIILAVIIVVIFFTRQN